MSHVLLPFKDVSARLSLGRTRIYAGIAANKFPKPVKVGTRCGPWFARWPGCCESSVAGSMRLSN
jgi:predicted DNA-binding transcriptional regulator AlpA